MRKLSSIARLLRAVLGTPNEKHPEFASVVDEMAHRLHQLAECEWLASPVFRKQVILRVRDFSDRLQRLAEARLVFESTETWRAVYEEVLQSCHTRRYLSVALIRSDDYWRDTPGERSLEFNYELIADGFQVHRIFLIDEFFWPRTARTPSTQLFHWIQNQRQRGVEVGLVRLTELEDESGLACDMGIYGSDAVGWQHTDFDGRTLRYEISFDSSAVAEAEQRWNQLLLFAKPFDEIVLVN